MEWLQILSLFLANAGLIVWFRTESRSDWKHMDAKVDAIQAEMKEFHLKLEKIETQFYDHMMYFHYPAKKKEK